MASYTITNSNIAYKQRYFTRNGINYPIIEADINVGAALADGDVLTFSGTLAPPSTNMVTMCNVVIGKVLATSLGLSFPTGLSYTWFISDPDKTVGLVRMRGDYFSPKATSISLQTWGVSDWTGRLGFIRTMNYDNVLWYALNILVKDAVSGHYIFNASDGSPLFNIYDGNINASYNQYGIAALDTFPYIAVPGTFDTCTFGSPTIKIVPALDAVIDGGIAPEPPADPYGPGGHSSTGGGGGTFDLESDTIGLPPIPTLSFAATGFTRIYNPTLAQLNSLANYLWTDQTFLNTVINHLKQLLENPMDAVISLSLLPCSIPNGTPESVKVMYINTGVSMAPATTQFVDVDCGTYTIEEFYGSALDYNPYTKVHCYLPYIGQVTLDTDEVMGKTLNVVYRIDIVTGMCAAMILVDQNVLYQFSGHCAINMPINSADFSGYIGAAMTAGKMVAGVVAGATGNLPLAGELIGAPAPKVTSTSQTTETVKTRNPKTGRQVTQWSDTKARETTASGASFGEMTRKAISNSVGAVMASKLTVEHAGGFTGNSGYLAVRRPYLIIERPRMCNPEEYGKYNGRPSMIYMNLGDCEGYTEVQSIQFENIPATNPELAELSELLKSGVLF